MNLDLAMRILRMVLGYGGLWLAARGVAPAEWSAFSTDIINAVPAVVAASTAGWQIWLGWGAKSVPEKTALRADVPTISPVTGAVQPGAQVTK